MDRTQQVEEMEREILKAIQWRVNPPTALAFVSKFLDLIPPHHMMNDTVRGVAMDLAKFQIEIAVTDYGLITVSPSTVALAALTTFPVREVLGECLQELGDYPVESPHSAELDVFKSVFALVDAQ